MHFLLQVKSYLSKLKFLMGFTPIIENSQYCKEYIPKPFKAVLTITADFELAWAWRYTKGTDNPLQTAFRKATLERNNLPGIIKLCEDFNIPITWATVGHLFLENCECKDNIKHSEIPKINPYSGPFWDFQGKDWFEHDPCGNYKDNPEWYAPDLIKMILDSPVNHEIGCHTFSHIDCRDDACPPVLLRAELQRCKELASEWGIELKSFVHPGHTIGNLDVLADEGFTNFRTDFRNVLGYPKKHKNGLWEFEQTAEFALRSGWSIDYHIYRYKEIIRRAIKSNTVCVFWFHPSFDEAFVNQIWPEVFSYINEKREDILVTTHRDYVAFLNSKNGEQ